MKYKSKSFRNEVENQIGKSIMIFQSDQGGNT